MTNFWKMTQCSALALGLLALTSPASFAAESLEIRNFIGTINWSNGELSASVDKNKGETEISGRDALVVEGGQSKIDGSDCKGSYGRYSLNWFGKAKEGQLGGFENLEDFPVLDIRLTKETKLIVRNSIIFTEGAPDIREADVELRYCGDLNLGDVETVFALDSRGSADVNVGRTGQIVSNLVGSGDFTTEDSNEVLIASRGSADIEIGQISELEASIHGSGDLSVQDIDGVADLSAHGSGDIDIGEVTGSLTYSGNGSGDLEVMSVEGESLTLQIRGSGDIDIAGGDVESLTASVGGSGSIDFYGDAERADLRASGSGDIYVNRVSGEAQTRSSGSGDIEIDQRD